MPDGNHAPVSFDSEPLVLVDEHDNEVGHLPKADAHRGHGTLHRAFSVFLFDDLGRTLLQQRSASKPLWPGYWSNSCCSHPRRGEETDEAVERRLREELGVRAELRYVYKFRYQADFGDVGAEHELCHVYVGTTSDTVEVHPDEISDWRWIAPDELDRELAAHPERFTPWFRMEWRELRTERADEVESLLEHCA
ncbi:MAG: isopentenyl-diphosphate Delta-isomerase [Wenzhouxiangellaceae bacterium]|nr:isopentenyl-diphosphate Delta-isomerase [Wenzhouxiangellaceae bacterium]